MKAREEDFKFHVKVKEYDNKLEMLGSKIDNLEIKLDIILGRILGSSREDVCEKSTDMSDKFKIEDMFIPDIDISRFKSNRLFTNKSTIKDVNIESGLNVFRELDKEKK